VRQYYNYWQYGVHVESQTVVTAKDNCDINLYMQSMFTWSPFKEYSGKEVAAVKKYPMSIRTGIPLMQQLMISSTKNSISCC
jgi:hypothetical protein